METSPTANRSLAGLFRALTGDTRTLLRQELQLAKTEITENISRMGREAIALAIGGFVAYTGLIIFLVGLGWLLAWAFTKAGLQPMFAAFLGIAVIGLLVIAVGGIFLLRSVAKLSHESLAPRRTLHTLHELKNGTSANAHHSTLESRHSAPATQHSTPSSKELQTRVETTEHRMEQTLGQLKHRLSPAEINSRLKHRISAEPYRAGAIAVAAGFLSGLIARRRFRHA
jgi:hypothetical protein